MQELDSTPTNITFYKEVTGEILGYIFDEPMEICRPEYKVGFSLGQGYHPINEHYVKTLGPATEPEYRKTVEELTKRGHLLNICKP